MGKKNRNETNNYAPENEKRERIEMEGVVIDANKGRFRVQISENHIALCTLSGKIRTNSVRILLGDVVKVELSEFDLTMGRIVYRIKAG